MACDGKDCKVEWIRFRNVKDEPIRVRRRPQPDQIENIEKDSEEWQAAQALAKRWIEIGLSPIYRRLEVYSCDGENCECKPTETPDVKADARWGPWEEADIAFIRTDAKGEETIVVTGEISRTTGMGICREAKNSVQVPQK